MFDDSSPVAQEKYYPALEQTRTRGDLFMPALKIGPCLRNCELGDAHEIDRDHRGDVGDAVIRSRDEFAVFQFTVEEFQESEHPRLVGLAPIRHLRHLHLRHRRMQMTEDEGERQEEMQFDAPVPHLDQRGFERADTEQRRIGVKTLEIATDRDRLGDIYLPH